MRTTARTLIFLIALAAFPALGHAADPGPSSPIAGVDGMTATVIQKDQSSFSGLGFRMRIHPQQLIAAIELMPTIEYWRNTNKISKFGIESTRKDATLAFDARYEFPVTGWHPYLGAGFGVHFISTRVNAPSLGLDEASDSLIKGGVSALGGFSFALSGRLSNLLELKYHHIPDHSQLKLNWGLSYTL